MRHAIEPLDQVDVTLKYALEIESRNVEAARCGKTHGRKLNPAFREAVVACLEFCDPRLPADIGCRLGARAAKRRSGGQQAAQVLVELIDVLRALSGFRQFLQGKALAWRIACALRRYALWSLRRRAECECTYSVIA